MKNLQTKFETFKQLKDAVGITNRTNRPTAKQLRESGDEIVAETPSLSVYKSGYFICTDGDHSTVFGVHEVKYLDFGEEVSTKNRIKVYDLDNLPWDYVLDTIGEFRLDHNTKVRNEAHKAGNIDDEESEAKLNAQGNPGVHRQLRVPYSDFVEDMFAKQEHEQKLRILAAGLKTLTDNERRTVTLYYDNRTEAEVAKILTQEKTDGTKVSQQAVHKTLVRAIKKLRKFFEESGC
jgi:hypothetical protein